MNWSTVAERELDDFIRDHGLVGIVVATTEGTELLRRGDLSRLEHGYLVDSLFHDSEQIRSAAAHLEQMMLPQNAAQKPDRCVYSRTASGLFYGLFHTIDVSVMELVPFSRGLAGEFETLLTRLIATESDGPG